MNIKIIMVLPVPFGVLTSTLVQLYLGCKTEVPRQRLEIRAEAYLGIMNSIKRVVNTAENDNESSLEKQKLWQAKFRAVVIGSDKVVKAMEEFWGGHEKLDTLKTVPSFTLIAAEIRKDLSDKNS